MWARTCVCAVVNRLALPDKMETIMAAFVEAELMIYFKPLLTFVRATTDPAAIDKDGAAALIKVRAVASRVVCAC